MYNFYSMSYTGSKLEQIWPKRLRIGQDLNIMDQISYMRKIMTQETTFKDMN